MHSPLKWYEDIPPQGSYRSIFKWGDPFKFKHPNARLVELLRQTFGITDSTLHKKHEMGLEQLDVEIPTHIDTRQIHKLENIVGAENIKFDTFSRAKAGYGKGMLDLFRLRKGILENLPDVVLYPKSKDEIENIVQICHDQHIVLTVRGCGSSVTRGTEAVKGGICLDLSVHYNNLVRFNETDQTVTVQAGMPGPVLENILNNAPQSLGAHRAYTCGHFPQSFEFSSVGGWVVTKGAGQNSTYYGKIEDIVIAQEMITPIGTIHTQAFPRSATGPDLNHILMGSEGIFGVLSEITLKIFRLDCSSRSYFSAMFKTWNEATSAVREIMQSEGGFPSVIRLSDAEETDVALNMYGVDGPIPNTILNRLGYAHQQRCLLIITADGGSGYTHNVINNIQRICKQSHALNLTPFKVTQRWEKGRWQDPYMREDLQDLGIITDTLECAVTWSNLDHVYSSIRNFIKSRPQTVCMTHLSHMYPQGTNLYFTFIAQFNKLYDYLEFQYGILEAILQSGAAMSHHHGIGKQTGPWLVSQAGKSYMDVLSALKNHFDPNHIMNPGGTLGLDMNDEQRNKRWGLNSY